MEKYDPAYQPFTSDDDGHFSFEQQPTAMHVNVMTLSESIEYLVLSTIKDATDEVKAEYSRHIKEIHEVYYKDSFMCYYSIMKSRKLGIITCSTFDKVEPIVSELRLKKTRDEKWRDPLDMLLRSDVLYTELLGLMHQYGCDYTVLFNKLSIIAAMMLSIPIPSISNPPVLEKELLVNCLKVVQSSVYNPQLLSMNDNAQWNDWLSRYFQALLVDTRIQSHQENSMHPAVRSVVDDRLTLQRSSNPRIILRNYLAANAYEELNTWMNQNKNKDLSCNTSCGSSGILDRFKEFEWCKLLQSLKRPYEHPPLTVKHSAMSMHELLKEANIELESKTEDTCSISRVKYDGLSPNYVLDLAGIAFMS